jgi:hypothetical protein
MASFESWVSFVFSAPPHITQISFYIATHQSPSLFTFFTGIKFRIFPFCGIFLFGASAAGRPRRPASDSIGVGGVVAFFSMLDVLSGGLGIGKL